MRRGRPKGAGKSIVGDFLIVAEYQKQRESGVGYEEAVLAAVERAGCSERHAKDVIGAFTPSPDRLIQQWRSEGRTDTEIEAALAKFQIFEVRQTNEESLSLSISLRSAPRYPRKKYKPRRK